MILYLYGSLLSAVGISHYILMIIFKCEKFFILHLYKQTGRQKIFTDTETPEFILTRRMHTFLLMFSFISQFHDDVSSWNFHERFSSGEKLFEGTHACSHTLHEN